MDYLYRNILEPAVPFLPGLLLVAGAVLLWWLIRVFIRPS
jgi:hypothetical protein